MQEPRIRFPTPGTTILVSEFINDVWKAARSMGPAGILYAAIEIIEERTKRTASRSSRRRCHNASPCSRSRPAASAARPTRCRSKCGPRASMALAIRWLISYASARKERSMAQRLASEFMAASTSEGSAIKKKEDTHKMAEANKAFAHFKW